MSSANLVVECIDATAACSDGSNVDPTTLLSSAWVAVCLPSGDPTQGFTGEQISSIGSNDFVYAVNPQFFTPACLPESGIGFSTASGGGTSTVQLLPPTLSLPDAGLILSAAGTVWAVAWVIRRLARFLLEF